ncbi:hypothetical protein PAPYR_83 [Paratrimastix pyriformis]|uniref:DOMON domain-containing protein n=1 Tax=Paratrimastix pyriformis TaxID=342808 RepID=A0ABQ8UWN4_9EUKA|nr:hypothetical protein PAPYR_83 [Paratrimastix pyriformis]
MRTSVLCLLFAAVFATELYPQPNFHRTIHPLDVYTNGFCLESGAPGTAQGVGSQQYVAVQPCRYGQIVSNWDGQKMTLGLGAIGGVAAAVVTVGDMQDIRQKYGLTSNINDQTAYLSIHFDEAKSKMVIVGKDATSSKMTFQDMITPDSAPLMTTKSGSVNFEPKAGFVYIGRLTPEPVSNSWEDTTLFFKLLVLEDGNGATDPEALEVRWDIFSVGSGVSIPTLPDDLCSSALSAAAGANTTGAVGVVMSILALMGVIAIPILFFIFRRRLIAFTSV